VGWRFARLGEYEEEKTTLPTSEILRRLAPLLSPYKRLMALLLVVTGLRLALSLAIPLVMGWLVDAALLKDTSSLLTYTLAFLAAICGYWAVGYARVYYISLLGQSFVRDLREKLVNALLRAKLARLRKEEVGWLLSRVMNDVDTIGGTFTSGLIDTAADLVTLVGAFVVMASLSPLLTLTLLPLIPVIFVLNYRFATRARRVFRKARKAIARVTSKVEQEVSGAVVVRSFYSRRRRDEAEFRRISAEYAETSVEGTKVIASVGPVMTVIGAVGIAIILYIGGLLVEAGAITIGVIVAFYGYLRMFFRPLETLAVFFNSVQSALAAAERVTTLLGIEKEDRGRGYRGEVLGVVEYNSVRFGYKENQPVVLDVSLRAEPGKITAIVGPTGSGKSTLAKLLMRFYEPWKGSITLDGRDVKDYDLGFLRRVVAYAPQEPMIFSGTVMDNLRITRPEINEEEVERLARELGVLEILRAIPGGLEGVVLEEGKNLSRGQRQIISLLRAILSKPRVLVLDEATSSVDVETELKIYEGIREVVERENITLIVIAHRLMAVKIADKIYVMDKGQIVEEGGHEDLLSLGGLYSKLWKIQTTGGVLIS